MSMIPSRPVVEGAVALRGAASAVCCVAVALACWQVAQALRRRRTARLIAEAAARARRPLPQPAAPEFVFTCRAEPGAALSQAFT